MSTEVQIKPDKQPWSQQAGVFMIVHKICRGLNLLESLCTNFVTQQSSLTIQQWEIQTLMENWSLVSRTNLFVKALFYCGQILDLLAFLEVSCNPVLLDFVCKLSFLWKIICNCSSKIKTLFWVVSKQASRQTVYFVVNGNGFSHDFSIV